MFIASLSETLKLPVATEVPLIAFICYVVSC